MEPSRLLDNARSGLERDLLRSALTDAAPETVRGHVLEVVRLTLAEGALAEAPASGEDLPVAAQQPRRALRARALQSSFAVALAAAAGAAVLLHAHVLSRPPATSAPKSEGAAEAPALAQLREPPEDAQRGAPEPAPLQSLPAPTAHAATLSPAASLSPAALAPAALAPAALAPTSLPASEPARSLRSSSHAEEDSEGDWLGAQLELLGAARGHIASGRLDQAGKLLGEYEQRFPGGVVRPQVERLRADLRERRAALQAELR